MEIGPILRALLKNKMSFGLLVIEIAIFTTIILNAVNLIIGFNKRLSIESGIAENEIMTLRLESYGSQYREAAAYDQMVLNDIDFLSQQNGVISAAAISNNPLIGGGSSTQLRPLDTGEESLKRSPRYFVTPDFINTLGLELIAGRTFTRQDLPAAPDPNIPANATNERNMIITQKFADDHFKDGNALGKVMLNSNGEMRNTIIGIVKYMHTPYDNGQSGMEYRPIFFAGIPGNSSGANYIVRVEKTSYDQLFTELEVALVNERAERIVNTQSLVELKEGGFFLPTFMKFIVSGILLLLLLVTALGIYGMTSFDVARRTKQIGVRRALGATKWEIMRYFLVENSLNNRDRYCYWYSRCDGFKSNDDEEYEYGCIAFKYYYLWHRWNMVGGNFIYHITSKKSI